MVKSGIVVSELHDSKKVKLQKTKNWQEKLKGGGYRTKEISMKNLRKKMVEEMQWQLLYPHKGNNKNKIDWKN